MTVDYKLENFTDPRDDYQKMRRTQLQVFLRYNKIPFNPESGAVELRRIAREHRLNPLTQYPSPEQQYEQKIKAQKEINPSWKVPEKDPSTLIADDIVGEVPVGNPNEEKGTFGVTGVEHGFQPAPPSEPVVPEPEVDNTPEIEVTTEAVPYDSMNFMQLKNLAKEKGMDVEPTTKKVDIMEFLNGSNEDLA